MQIEDRGDVGLTTLEKVTQEMVQDGNSQSGLTALNSTFRAAVPQVFVDVDRTKVKTLGIPLSSIFDTPAGVPRLGLRERLQPLRPDLSGAHPGRAGVSALRRTTSSSLEVRNPAGQMVPLGTLVDVQRKLGRRSSLATTSTRQRRSPASRRPGYSSGQALSLMEQMAAAKLPAAMGYEWTAMSYQEKKAGREAFLVFGLAVLLVYLVLAAQYESWFNPAPWSSSCPSPSSAP